MSHNKYTHLELQPALQFLLISGSSIQKQFLVNRRTSVGAKVIAKSECINTFDTSTWESTIYFFKSYQKVVFLCKRILFSYEMEK